MGPGAGSGPQDAIVADRCAAYVLEAEYVDFHMDWYHYPNAQALRERRENNVGYGDGHVETHSQKPYIGSDGYLTWEGAHYVEWRAGTREIY